MIHITNRGTHDNRSDSAMRTSTLAALGVLLVLSGCAQTRDVAAPGPGHPASSQNAAVPFTPPQNPFAVAVESAGAQGATPMTHGAHETQGVEPQSEDGLTAYTCPMHPEVRADRPGACPKCGMALTPTTMTRPHGSHEGGPR